MVFLVFLLSFTTFFFCFFFRSWKFQLFVNNFKLMLSNKINYSETKWSNQSAKICTVLHVFKWHCPTNIQIEFFFSFSLPLVYCHISCNFCLIKRFEIRQMNSVRRRAMKAQGGSRRRAKQESKKQAYFLGTFGVMNTKIKLRLCPIYEL